MKFLEFYNSHKIHHLEKCNKCHYKDEILQI